MAVDTIEKTEISITKPEDYVVIMLNDDRTTFDAVIYILAKVFKKSIDQGEAIAYEIHEKGRAVVTLPIPKDVAETMARVAMDIALEMGMPLKLIVEVA